GLVTAKTAGPATITVATAALPLDHVIVRPDSGLPPASFGVAVSCVVWPTCRVAVAGLTVTDATGTTTAVTVIAAVPLCPSLAAVIVAAPTVTPVTTPLVLTVATDGLELVHVTVRPVSGLPFTSWSVAVSCSVCPTGTLPDAGLTATEATDA